MKTKKQLILEHLDTGGTITQKESIQWFGCASLAQRIKELRREGYPIETHFRTIYSHNSHTTFAEYKLYKQ